MLSVNLTRIVTKSTHSRAINLSVAKMSTTLPDLLPLPISLDEKLRETHGYMGTAHWVIPGRLMQGARPGFGLSSASSQTETELDAQLRDLASNAKIKTFVCAQAECLPEEGSILLDGDGGTRKDNPKDSPAYAHRIIDSKFLYYGIIGMKPAKSVESLSNAAHDVANRVRDGETVYIHCGGGVGRAGLLTACVLGVLYPTLKADEAIEYCTALCHLRNMNGEDKVYHSPETDDQQQQVRDFFQKMLGR